MAHPNLLSRALPLGLLALLFISSTLSADRLVTTDGQVIETRGAWKLQGKMVVFTMANGTFSSLRLDKVDLSASRTAEELLHEQQQADREAEAAKVVEKQKEPAKPILELTDADLPKRRAKARTSPTPPENASQENSVPSPKGPSVTVSNFQRVDRPDGGFEIVGSFVNGSNKMASAIEVTVMLYDDKGAIVDAVPASLTSASLGPDEQGQFTATFDQTRPFTSMKFDISSFDIEANDS